MLLSRSQNLTNKQGGSRHSKSKGKNTSRDAMQLSKMIHSNSRYLTVQHGGPNGGDRSYNQKGSAAVERNKIYASR